MKVAFWSDFRREGGVTGSLAAISAVCVLHYHKNIALSSNHFSDHSIQDCFGKTPFREGRARTAYCYCYGESEYFRMLWEGYVPSEPQVLQCQLMEGVYLLHPPDLLEPSLFRETVPEDMLSFLDVTGEHHSATNQALEEADIVAVFLPQNMAAIRNFFDQYSSLIPKSIFFISNYRRAYKRKAGCSPAQFVRNFDIESQKVGTIPYNEDFAEAYEEGRIEHFIRENLSCTPKNRNYNFMNQLFAAAEMILHSKEGVKH